MEVSGDGVTWRELDLNASMKHVQHSPTRFNWGYAGSGPAQLGFALILHATGKSDVAFAFYQVFKFDLIATMPAECNMTDENIKKWIAQAKEAQLD